MYVRCWAVCPETHSCSTRQHDCFGAEPLTHIAYETGVATCAFEDEELTSLFTIAYRPIEFDVENTYVLSSLVEAPLPGMRSRLMTMLGGGRDIAERWLERYLKCSLLPIVQTAGERGIHFEAHLQNTGGYHGSTQATMSMSGNLSKKQHLQSLLPDVHFLPFGCSRRGIHRRRRRTIFPVFVVQESKSVLRRREL